MIIDMIKQHHLNQLTTKKQQGVSLIEVLISATLILTGLYGITHTYVNSIVGLQHSQNYASAAIYAKDLVERVRSNPAGLPNYVHTELQDLSKKSANCGSTCTGPQIANLDLKEWDENRPQALPKSARTSASLTGDTLTISITWDGDKSGIKKDHDTYSISVTPRIATL